MLEIAQNFEQMAADFSPVALIVPGLVCVLAGLFIWLGGLGYTRLLALVAGAITGGICTFFWAGQNIILTVVLAAAAAVIAVVLKKIFMIILTAGVVLVLCLAFLIYPYISRAKTAPLKNLYDIENAAQALNLSQTLETIKTYSAGMRSEIKSACSEMPAYYWAIIALLVLAFVAAGFFIWNLTSAFCCAALGTMLIFAGMILLLLYKGAQPITSISNNSSFYAVVFTVMTAAGTVEQLLLCRHAGKKPAKKKENEQQAVKQKNI